MKTLLLLLGPVSALGMSVAAMAALPAWLSIGSIAYSGFLLVLLALAHGFSVALGGVLQLLLRIASVGAIVLSALAIATAPLAGYWFMPWALLLLAVFVLAGGDGTTANPGAPRRG